MRELEKELGIEIFTRSSQGIALTVDGAEFLTYARQVLDQAALLEERYKNAKPRKQLCSVATQHYMFAVEAFVEMIKRHAVGRVRVHDPRDAHPGHHQPGGEPAVGDRHPVPVGIQPARSSASCYARSTWSPPLVPLRTAGVHLTR